MGRKSEAPTSSFFPLEIHKNGLTEAAWWRFPFVVNGLADSIFFLTKREK